MTVRFSDRLFILPALLSVALVAATFITTSQPASAAGRVIILTEKNNEGDVNLRPGDTLVVRLSTNPSTGYSWNVVVDPGSPIQFVKQVMVDTGPHGSHGHLIVGAPKTVELHFRLNPAEKVSPDMTSRAYLRLLYLRPFEKGLGSSQLWECRVSW